jgi:hypothetical protein
MHGVRNDPPAKPEALRLLAPQKGPNSDSFGAVSTEIDDAEFSV